MNLLINSFVFFCYQSIKRSNSEVINAVLKW